MLCRTVLRTMKVSTKAFIHPCVTDHLICKDVATCTMMVQCLRTSATPLNTLSKDVLGKKNLLRSAQQAKQEVIADDATSGIDLTGLTEAGITIPTLETQSMLIAGVRYDELPVAHIKSSLNNTIMTVTDYKGTEMLAMGSCGSEGFRNVKKSTNVAAQATGLAVGFRAMKKGVHHVRVCIQGLGAGRLFVRFPNFFICRPDRKHILTQASMKGLQLAGMQIVSITDTTRIPHSSLRKSRKARRL